MSCLTPRALTGSLRKCVWVRQVLLQYVLTAILRSRSWCVLQTASNQKLRRYLPNFTFTSLEEGIKETVTWFTKTYPNVRKGYHS